MDLSAKKKHINTDEIFSFIRVRLFRFQLKFRFRTWPKE